MSFEEQERAHAQEIVGRLAQAPAITLGLLEDLLVTERALARELAEADAANDRRIEESMCGSPTSLLAANVKLEAERDALEAKLAAVEKLSRDVGNMCGVAVKIREILGGVT